MKFIINEKAFEDQIVLTSKTLSDVINGIIKRLENTDRTFVVLELKKLFEIVSHYNDDIDTPFGLKADGFLTAPWESSDIVDEYLTKIFKNIYSLLFNSSYNLQSIKTEEQFNLCVDNEMEVYLLNYFYQYIDQDRRKWKTPVSRAKFFNDTMCKSSIILDHVIFNQPNSRFINYGQYFIMQFKFSERKNFLKCKSTIKLYASSGSRINIIARATIKSHIILNENDSNASTLEERKWLLRKYSYLIFLEKIDFSSLNKNTTSYLSRDWKYIFEDNERRIKLG